MLPKSVLFGGVVVGIGIIAIWALGGRGGDVRGGEFEELQSQASAESSGRKGKDRRSVERALGTGVGKRKMSRNEIMEVGKQLRWELNPLRRRAALGRLLEGMNEGNAMLVREQIVHFSEESPEFQDFHFAWGAMSGVDAVQMGADTKEKDMAATMTGWASIDPVGALSWYDTLEEDRRKCRDVTFGMLKGLASSDLVFATDFALRKLEAEDERAGEMLGVVKEKMLEVETLPRTAAWALELPEGKVRNETLMEVTGEFVKREPEEAAYWAATLEGEEGARVKKIVAAKWAQEDPIACLEWAQKLPDGPGKSASIGEVVLEWTGQDPDAVYEFLNGMSYTNERDAAVEAFSMRISGDDPHSAIAWAEEIQESEARRSAIIRAGRALMRQSAEEGRQWLQNSGLTDEVQREIEK